MALYLVGVTTGLVLGVLTGGHLRAVAGVRPSWPLTTFGAVSALVVVRLGVGDAGIMLAFALGIAAAAAAANRQIAGMGVVTVGLLANLAPVLLDGGTPVDPAALGVAGNPHPADGLLPTQHLETDRTSLPVLSSRIPIPGGSVASFGDLIIAVGLAAAAANATRRQQRIGIPVSEILASGPLTIQPPLVDLTSATPETSLAPPLPRTPAAPTIARAASHPRERPVEVGPGTTVPIPAGWEPADDDAAALATASLRPRIALSHPTMRLLHR